MCIDHDPYQTQAPAGRKVYMGTCCQTPVTPLGFKRLLDTVFYIPVAPLGLKSCGYHFFYTPIAPLGLKSCGCFRCYKHIVPTGLKRLSRTRETTKLTPMVRLQNAPTVLGTAKLTHKGFAALYPTYERIINFVYISFP